MRVVACCTALLAKGSYGPVGWLVRLIELLVSSSFLASLVREIVGEEEGAKIEILQVLRRGGGALGLVAVVFRSLAAPGGLRGALARCVSCVVVVVGGTGRGLTRPFVRLAAGTH